MLGNSKPSGVIGRSLPEAHESDVMHRAENIATLQKEDPDIGVIVRLRLQKAEEPTLDEMLGESEITKALWAQWFRLVVLNGVVYRADFGSKGRPQCYQLLVPTVLKEDIIRSCHTGMAGGHLGVRKTLDQVRRRAFWIGWRREVERHCRRCIQCNCYHRGKLPKTAPLQPTVVGAPLERMSLDLCGPFPRSSRGNVYIVTCCDVFTKWTEAIAVPNKEATTVARVLVEQVFCRLGTPLTLLSDQGGEVDGTVMREICKLLGIEKLRTTGYKPSTNAQIERFHRTLNSMIGRVISEKQKEWDTLLPYVMAAFRASVHESTGFTANLLMLNREVRAPVDIALGLQPPETTEGTYDDFVEEIERRQRIAYDVVRKHLDLTALRAKKYYDLTVRPRKFGVGDWVYLYCPRRYQGKADKWLRKYSGPYLVVQVLGPMNVRVQKFRSRGRPEPWWFTLIN